MYILYNIIIQFDCYSLEKSQENISPIRLWTVILPVTGVVTLVVTLTICFFTVASVAILRKKCKYNAYQKHMKGRSVELIEMAFG